MVPLRRRQPVFPCLKMLYACGKDNKNNATRFPGLAATAGVVLATLSIPFPEGCMRWQAMNTIGRKIYHVQLEEDERARLREIVDGGKGSSERRRRAHILLLADRSRDDGGRSDADIAGVLDVGTATVERVRKQCVLDGLEAALERKAQANRKKRLLDGEGEAKLVMLACSAPPPGQARWTLRLLGERLVELEIVDAISDETVRRTLKKTASSPG